MNPMRVRVNDELTLDAGWWEEVQEQPGGPTWRHVHAPATPMFRQVLDYLEAQPDPGWSSLRIGQEAVAATAVCLRWGSYLAVLLDRDKPLWAEAETRRAREARLSRISDEEMARINIEMSAALEQWIDVMRLDWDRYLRLMHVASARLPMTRKSVSKGDALSLLPLAGGQLAALMGLVTTGSLGAPEVWAETQAHPTRVFSNALAHLSWRNNDLLKDIHAGRSSDYPLAQCRLTTREERSLMRTTAEGLLEGIKAAYYLTHVDTSSRSWPERVLPFRVVPFVAPHGWSLDAATLPLVRLYGPEPPVAAGG